MYGYTLEPMVLIDSTDTDTDKFERYSLALRCSSHFILALVCNPTLQVIGLHRPCMEKAGVAVNALQIYLTLKY